jgi:hypothetical protein
MHCRAGISGPPGCRSASQGGCRTVRHGEVPSCPIDIRYHSVTTSGLRRALTPDELG